MSLLKITGQKKLIKENMKLQTQDNHDLGGTQDLFTRHESQERKKKKRQIANISHIHMRQFNCRNSAMQSYSIFS